MRVPNFLYADDINNNMASSEINGYWFVAKPLGFNGICLKRRLYLAFSVFIGKYDVIFYEQDRKDIK